MKTKDYEARAMQDVTIGELPKQDNPNNSDLLVIQGASLTEATSIQQLKTKILSGGVGSGGDTIGVYRFSATLIEDLSWGLMDGTQYTKEQKEDFYSWLLEQDSTTKQAFSLDTIAEKFILPNYSGLGLKVTNTSGVKNTVGGVVNHKHTINVGDGVQSTTPTIIGISDFYHLPPRSTTQGGSDNANGNRCVIGLFYEGDAGITKIEATPNPKNTNNQTLEDVPYPYFTGFCYVKMTNGVAVDVVSSPYIKSDGSVAMDLDYTPTDIQDVATKRYIDNKFLNYEVPLSFSINDIGKRVPYYSNAENNPTLIALDGTKYLISDYPDFDYETQEGFTNDGVYFWFANIELELKSFQNYIQTSKEWFKLPLYSGLVKGQTLVGNFEFNSKMIYNFLNSPQGARFLFANDTLGENAKNNGGFTILDPVEYRIRANYNNFGGTRDADVPPTSIINKYKQSFESISVDGFGGAVTAFPFYSYIAGTGISAYSIGYTGTTGEVGYLKIQPDYMVAKIQQVGGGASGSGDLKSDRSVPLTGAGTFNTKQIAGMDDLKDSNIIVTDEARVITTLKDKLDAMDTIITNLTTKLNSYDTKYRSFTCKRVKSGLNVAINSNATNLTNLTQYFRASQNPVVTSFGSSISGLPLGAINLIEVGTGVNQGFKFPIIDGIVNANLTFTIRVTGSISGPAGNPRELICYLRRVSDNSIVANGGIIKVNDNNFNSRSVIVPSFIQGATDPFYASGFYLDLLNNSGGNLTLTSLELLIQG
jgi:hypothetical protein